MSNTSDKKKKKKKKKGCHAFDSEAPVLKNTFITITPKSTHTWSPINGSNEPILKLLLLVRNTWNYMTVQTNDHYY